MILSFALILIFQLVLQWVLTALNIQGIWFSLIFDLVVSFVFALLDFRGQEKLKNPAFHGRFATYFAILTVISLLFGLF